MDIKKCVELYRLMAKRCSDCGVAPNQAKIYEEMVDFISSCNSVEDSMKKIKNSKYYLAPSVALVKDKLGAWKSAAIKNDMPEIVEVVDDKLAKIEADNSEIYVTGHEQTIQRHKNNYILTMQAFALIFDAYVGYIATGEEYNLSDIDKQIQVLKYPSSDFVQLANLPVFRSLIIVDDAGYEMYVNDIASYIKTGNLACGLFASDNFDIDVAFAPAWEAVQARKNDIIEAGKNPNNPCLYRHKLPEMKALAPNINMEDPSNIDGLKYEYVEADFFSKAGKPYNSAKSACEDAFSQPACEDASSQSSRPSQHKKQGLFSRLRGGN